MIRIWNVTIKKSTERRKDITHSIGIEEENHELIIWKHWVGFLPKNDFFHHVILRQNLYILMDALLKIGTYSICMKREDNTHLYSANIVGISPYMLENVTGYERHTILAKFQDLAELGYISFTTPTRGETSEMNILLNEYNKTGLQVFKIEERSWLNERMIVEKESMFGEYEDIRDIGHNSGIIHGDIVGLLPIDTQQQGGLLVESLPINTADKSGGLVETLPISSVNTIDDLIDADTGLISRVFSKELFCKADDFEGIAKDFLLKIWGIATNQSWGDKGGPDVIAVDVSSKRDVKNSHSRRLWLPEKTESVQNRQTTVGFGNQQTAVGFSFDPLKYPTSTRIVAMFYQQETGLTLTEMDLQFISEALKISAIPQIMTAIQSAKVWRATLPTNFDKLNAEDKKKRVSESQPGFYLRVMGMKHVYNFIKNSPRYRKRGRRGISTGVKSGLNRKRALEKQTKIIKEIREKHKQEIEKIK